MWNVASTRRSLALTLVCLLAGTAGGQEQPTPGLRKSEDGKSYTHAASKTQFQLPLGWEVQAPMNIGRTSTLGLRKSSPDGKPGIEATITWSPFGIGNDDADALERAKELERDLLVMVYGADKIGQPETVSSSDKNGFRIPITDGPTRNDKEVGVVYLFVTGADQNRWKVKLRGIVMKRTMAEDLKVVEGLLKEFKW